MNRPRLKLKPSIVPGPGGSLSNDLSPNIVRPRRLGWRLKVLCLLVLSLCALSGRRQPFVTADERVLVSPPATVTAAPSLLPIPQPNLSALEGIVKDQIEAAWSDLQAVSQKSGADQGELAEAYGQMGKVYQTYNFSDSAAVCYQNARALAPRQLDWPYYLGVLHQEKGETKEAISYLKIAQELAPNEIPVLVNLAEAYLASGQSELAKALFEKSLALDNSLAAAMAGVGKIALSRGDYAGAIRSLEAAVRLQPQATSLHYPLAMAYRGAGDVEKALTHLREQGPGKPKIPDPLADDLERLKKGEMILWRRGNQAMNDGHYSDAVKLYEQMVGLASDDPLPRIYLGNALAAANDLKGALEQYEQVLRLRPNNSTAHYNFGVILLHQHSEQEALEHFRTAVASDPGFKLAHFQLANLLMRNAHYEDAIPHYARVIELSPDNEFARLMKSMALIRLRRYAAAKAELEEGEASLPESADLASALARLLAACPDKTVRDGPRALRLTEKLLKAHPSPEFELVETYGMALASVGRHSEAAELQRQMLSTVESAGRSDLAAVIKRNLSFYQQRQNCPLPWRDDDPIFAPQPGKMMLTVPKENLRMAKGGSLSP